MNLESLLSDLAYGELSNLSMAQEPVGTIREADLPKVIRFINDSLLRLHTLFILRERNVVIEQVDHITFYHLLPQFAESSVGSAEPIKYIKDLYHEPFGNDVIRILEVRDGGGHELPLNDREDYRSVFTPQASLTLQVPHPCGGHPMTITYQAKHPDVSAENPKHTIFLPEVLHVPLRLHVGFQVHSSIGTQEANAKASELLARFDSLCNEAEERDLVNTSIATSNTTFEKRGFV